jgi:hypothetical protein
VVVRPRVVVRRVVVVVCFVVTGGSTPVVVCAVVLRVVVVVLVGVCEGVLPGEDRRVVVAKLLLGLVPGLLLDFVVVTATLLVLGGPVVYGEVSVVVVLGSVVPPTERWVEVGVSRAFDAGRTPTLMFALPVPDWPSTDRA